MVIVAIYTNLGLSPLWLIIVLNVILFVGISTRIISSSALMTAIPEPQDRGAFMSINSSVQQISGGVASAVAGLIVVQNSDGILKHYNTLGYVVMCTMVITVALMYWVNWYVNHKSNKTKSGIIKEEPSLIID